MNTCRKCNALITWATIVDADGQPKPKAHPFDYIADPNGKWRIENKGAFGRGVATAHYDPPGPHVPGVPETANPERYTSHFSTCPYAEQFRPQPTQESLL